MKKPEHSDLLDSQNARHYLEFVGTQDDEKIHLFHAALALAAVHRPTISLQKYLDHFEEFCQDLRHEFDDLCASENSDDVLVQVKALQNVMARKFGYLGDRVDYDNLQNVDMMRVVDRRLGMPITLCILSITACREMEWHAEGMNFPGHFIMRLDHEGQRMIIDPFQGCVEMNAPELRDLLKRNVGKDAELSSQYYEACSNRDILLRLQNNIKYRLIDSEQYQEALEIVDLMCLIAPDDYRLDLDMGVLLARLERPKAAIDYLESYIEKVKTPSERQEAELFLLELKSILH